MGNHHRWRPRLHHRRRPNRNELSAVRQGDRDCLGRPAGSHGGTSRRALGRTATLRHGRTSDLSLSRSPPRNEKVLAESNSGSIDGMAGFDDAIDVEGVPAREGGRPRPPEVKRNRVERSADRVEIDWQAGEADGNGSGRSSVIAPRGGGAHAGHCRSNPQIQQGPKVTSNLRLRRWISPRDRSVRSGHPRPMLAQRRNEPCASDARSSARVVDTTRWTATGPPSMSSSQEK